LGRDLDRDSHPLGSWEGRKEEGKNLKEGRRWLGRPWSKPGEERLHAARLRGGGRDRRGLASGVAGAHVLSGSYYYYSLKLIDYAKKNGKQ
jgi:hypothetical protein